MASDPEFRKIPITELALDSTNPRLPKSLHGASEDKILEYMLLDGSLIELMLAIGKNDFFMGEQLLVVPQVGKSGKKYKAVEGNRRLSAVILLNNPEKAKIQKRKVKQVIEDTDKRPKSIPCLVFEFEDDIYDYLGYRHITGIKEWKLLEKARYLNNLFHTNYKGTNFKNSCRELAKCIGSRRDYVERLVVGYEVFKIIEDNAFYKIVGLDDTTFWFNYIADSLNKDNICSFLNIQINDKQGLIKESLDCDNLKRWVTWFFQKNQQGSTRLIGDSKTLTLLNKVLGDDEARRAFVEDGISLTEAFELTDEVDFQFLTYLRNSIRLLERADSISLKVSHDYFDIRELLNQTNRLLKKIADTLQSKTSEEDEF